MSRAQAAFLELAEHCLRCPGCQPDLEAPGAGRPECGEAMALYWEWSRVRREESAAAR